MLAYCGSGYSSSLMGYSLEEPLKMRSELKNWKLPIGSKYKISRGQFLPCLTSWNNAGVYSKVKV